VVVEISEEDDRGEIGHSGYEYGSFRALGLRFGSIHCNPAGRSLQILKLFTDSKDLCTHAVTGHVFSLIAIIPFEGEHEGPPSLPGLIPIDKCA
jgi:hypothetical protein